jgi:hypothetical protein
MPPTTGQRAIERGRQDVRGVIFLNCKAASGGDAVGRVAKITRVASIRWIPIDQVSMPGGFFQPPVYVANPGYRGF